MRQIRAYPLPEECALKTGALDLEPHGILFGQRHYLVAFREDAMEERHPRLYSLPNILAAEVLPGIFERRLGFRLSDYAARSFGVFQEKPQKVIWRFAPHLAADAAEHTFHPTEEKRALPDGSLEVRFRAGGLAEMAWHLFTWGPGVTIVAPDDLRDLYRTLLRDALRGVPAAKPGRERITEKVARGLVDRLVVQPMRIDWPDEPRSRAPTQRR
jgi:predicted DNA-binding transcriptional regulator YafY